MALKKIVVLFSGQGTNMENIIKKMHKKELEVVAAITNKPEAGGIKRAKALGVKVEILPHTEFSSREEFDWALVKLIKSYAPDLTVLAGFMRILTPVFTDNIKAINIHPSYLPHFKGTNAIKRSFESGMKHGGVSVHYVTSELDAGEIIMQEKVPILEGDTLESFEARVHAVEYELYPKAILKALGV